MPSVRGDARAHHRAGRIDEPGTEDRDRGVGLHNVVEVVVDAEVVDRRADCREVAVLHDAVVEQGREQLAEILRVAAEEQGVEIGPVLLAVQQPGGGYIAGSGDRAWQRHAEYDPYLGATRRATCSTEISSSLTDSNPALLIRKIAARTDRRPQPPALSIPRILQIAANRKRSTSCAARSRTVSSASDCEF